VTLCQIFCNQLPFLILGHGHSVRPSRLHPSKPSCSEDIFGLNVSHAPGFLPETFHTFPQSVHFNGGMGPLLVKDTLR
jgi:hypothetical protein